MELCQGREGGSLCQGGGGTHARRRVGAFG
jgi:hypothetical protein